MAIKTLTPDQMKKWEEKRAQGRKRFILLRGVLGFGIPFFLAMELWTIFSLQAFHAELAVVLLALSLVGGFAFGAWIWKYLETAHARTKAAESATPLPSQEKGLGALAWIGIGCGSIIVLGIIGVVIFSVMFGGTIKEFAEEVEEASVGGLSDLEAVGKTGEAFLTALKKGDAAGSFSLLADDLQKEVGGAAAWSEKTKNAVPTSWHYEALDVAVDSGRRTLTYSATLQDGRASAIELVAAKAGGDWKVTAIKLSPR